MKARVIDSPDQLREQPQQQQPQQPPIEELPVYHKALAQVYCDMLGGNVGDLADARAKAAVYQQSASLLQRQMHAIQQKQDEIARGVAIRAAQEQEPKEDSPAWAKIQRRLDSETRERQALEAQLKAKQKESGTRLARLRNEIDQLEGENASLLGLVADIRTAAGDPEGKLMQEDLIKHVENLVKNQKKPRKKAAPKKTKATAKKK